MRVRRHLYLALLGSAALAFAPPPSLWADTPPAAEAALLHGHIDEALRLLSPAVSSGQASGSTHLLLCRTYFAEDQFDRAIAECESATAAEPNSSETQMWLGRVYGGKADHANPVSAFNLGRRVRSSFERAVELDPANLDAASDLGEFYVHAPSIIGGGVDKARALAGNVLPRSAALAHRLLAQAAEKDSDFATAEAEFKKAVDVSHAPESMVDLGYFYYRRKQMDQAAAAAKAAADADHAHDAWMVEAANLLIDVDRSPDLAIRFLREYLASAQQSDTAPAFKVHLKLSRLLEQAGDRAGAHRETEEAVSLASDYPPSRKAARYLSP